MNAAPDPARGQTLPVSQATQRAGQRSGVAWPREERMRVKVLKYAVARDAPPDLTWSGEHPAWDDPVHRVADPTWDDIEGAVRRLDGRKYRWLFLWPTADPADH